jgi:hypothetical protein
VAQFRRSWPSATMKLSPVPVVAFVGRKKSERRLLPPHVSRMSPCGVRVTFVVVLVNVRITHQAGQWVCEEAHLAGHRARRLVGGDRRAVREGVGALEVILGVRRLLYSSKSVR